MNEYMSKTIREVIEDIPGIGELLGEYGIGCVTCSVGTCLVKDILSIHNLPDEQQKALMKAIEKLIASGKNVFVPDSINAESKTENTPKIIGYSRPVQMLVDEHVRIKAFIRHVPRVCSYIESKEELDVSLIMKCVDFIRNYADRFHHAKEEDILFKYLSTDWEIIKVMYQDHDTGRGYVAAIVEALKRQDGQAGQVIIKALNDYSQLLTQHIKKEDEVLYPWIDRELAGHQITEISNRFEYVENMFDKNISRMYDSFIKSLEQLS